MFNKNIKVDELTHKYFIDLPSVSSIINLLPKYQKDYSEVSEHILKAAQIQGNCLHKRIEFFIDDEIDLGCLCYGYNQDIHNDIFNKCKDHYLKEIVPNLKDKQSIWTEISLMGEYYTGTFDLAYIDKDNNFVIYDWKTTSQTHWNKVCLQLYCYGILAAKYLGNVKKEWVKDIKLKCYNPKLDKFKEFKEKEIEQAQQEYKEIIEILSKGK